MTPRKERPQKTEYLLIQTFLPRSLPLLGINSLATFFAPLPSLPFTSTFFLIAFTEWWLLVPLLLSISFYVGITFHYVTQYYDYELSLLAEPYNGLLAMLSSDLISRSGILGATTGLLVNWIYLPIYFARAIYKYQAHYLDTGPSNMGGILLTIMLVDGFVHCALSGVIGYVFGRIGAQLGIKQIKKRQILEIETKVEEI